MESSRSPSPLAPEATPAPAEIPGASVDPRPGRARPHVAELDGVRGLAILMIFLHHYVSIDRADSGPLRVVAAAIQSLWCGVDLFFVLSGFLITGILLDTRGSRSYFRTFFIRRSLRIFPLYFGLLAAALLVLPWVVPFDSAADRRLIANQGWLWAYGTNLRIMAAGFGIFQGSRIWLDHLWSLAVEEHFYLAWPFVVSMLSPRRLRWACLGCAVGALGLRAGLLLTPALTAASYVATPCRVDALTIGGLLAILVREPDADASRQRRAAIAILGTVGPALLALFAWRNGLDWEDPIVSTIGFTLLATYSAALILAALSFDPAGPFRRGLRLDALRSLGRYSYGLYLYHVALEPNLNTLLSTAKIQGALGVPYPAAGAIRVVSTFAVCFGVAFLSWHLFERPILGLKRRFEYARSA